MKDAKKKAKLIKVPNYRSGLELHTAQKLKELNVEAKYEHQTLAYVLEKQYLPDFSILRKRSKPLHLECKGRFRPGDQAKMLAVARANPEVEIVFVFMKPELPVRKGAKLTHADWAERHNFRWCTLETLHDTI